MDFEFSPEQELFRGQVRRALAETCDLADVRRAMEDGDERTAVRRRVWAMLARLGVTALTEPLDLCVAAEEIGRALAPSPALSSLYLFGQALAAFGSEAQQARWLPALAEGAVLGAAVLHGRPLSVEGGRAGGVLSPVAGGEEAAVLVAPGPAGLVLVELTGAATRRRRLVGLDPTQDLCALEIDGAPAERLAGADARAVRDRGAILLAFEQLGGAERALEMSCDYARQRRTFNRPIGSYQGIKHKLADVWTANRLARAHACYGGWALDAASPDLDLAAASARVAATDAFLGAAREMVQVHGGLGFTWEADCQLFYKRARAQAAALGSSPGWTRRLGEMLADGRRPVH